MSALGGSIGATVGSLFGIPPQIGYAGGSMLEDTVVNKKKKKNAEKGKDSSGLDAYAAVSSMFGGRGEGGQDDPYMAAIQGMAGGEPGIDMVPEEKELNRGRGGYAPPMLMGFPSAQRSGRMTAIKQALAASRGF